MGSARFAGRGSALWCGAAVAVAALVPAALAGSGQAVAAAHPAPGAPGAGRVTTAGVISTLAGGIGGPGPATNVALTPCGVAFANGHLYVGDTHTRFNVGVLRQMSLGSSQLTSPIGTYGGGGLRSGIPAGNASIGPCAAAGDHSGNLVIGDRYHDVVRVVAASTGTFYGQAMTAGDIYTIAGTGTFGFSGDGGPATSAELSDPFSVAVDAAGNVVIADLGNNRVRVVAASTGTFYGQAMTAGDIYTIAGNGTAGFAGDGGPATSAELNHPVAVAVDPAGNVVIGDADNGRVRVVAEKTGTFYGQAMTAQDIYTGAGDGSSSFSGNGIPATSAGVGPRGVALDAAGNMVIADASNRVRVVAEKAGTFYGKSMQAGFIYTVATSIPASGVAVDSAGNLVVAAQRDNQVRAVAATTGTFYGQAMTAGNTYVIAGNGNPHGFSGDGGPATSAELKYPAAVAVDSAGNVAFADVTNERIRVVAAATGTFYGQAMTAGNIYTVAGNGTAGFSGDGGPATSAQLRDPSGIAVDAARNLLIADTANARIRVVAATTGTFYRQAMTAGDIYTIAGNGKSGFAGDFGPATKAELNNPDGVAVDAAGNLLIADVTNGRIRVVAAKTGTFYGIAMKAGDIYTVAGNGGTSLGDGGPALDAGMAPDAVEVDAAGNLVISDEGHNRIRVVAVTTGTFYGQAMTAGDIYTVAGNGGRGFAGDGGPATNAEFNGPAEIAVDAAGNLVIDDSANNRIRVVAEHTGAFYGQTMTAGDIYTVAGGGTRSPGDGGPATKAKLKTPFGVAVNGGNLVIGDTGDSRIREVTG